MIDRSTVLRRAPDVRYRAIDDETVVIRQEAAEALVLNEVAGRLLDLIDGRRTVAAIVAELQNEYDVAPETLAADVAAYLTELLESRLLIDSATVGSAS
jgi:coenzyme PQQ biosynthesis protein PqqD